MFREVSLSPEEREHHRFLFQEEDGDIKDYCMRRLTLGVSSSPYLALQVLRRTADDYQKKYTTAARLIKKDFYVNDVLTEASTVEEHTEFRTSFLTFLPAGGDMCLPPPTQQTMNPGVYYLKTSSPRRWTAVAESTTMLLANSTRLQAIVLPELRLVLKSTAVPVISDLWQRYSQLKKLVRIVAWCSRFIGRYQGSKTEQKPRLTATEQNAALTKLLRLSQTELYTREFECLSRSKPVSQTSNLYSLQPMIRSNGLLRVGGRLQKSEVANRHPIILHRAASLTKLLVQ